MANTIPLAVLSAYIAAMLAIGFWSYRRSRSLREFYLADRKLGTWIVAFSFFATYFSTAAFLGGGGSGFLFGFQWSAWLTFWHVVCAAIAWLLVAPRLREVSERLNSLTIPDLMEFMYGSRAPRLIAALIIILAFEFYMISIYKGAGELLSRLLGVSYETGILITVLPVAIYTAIGGFLAVTITDFIQGILALGGGVTLFLLVLKKAGGLGSAISTISTIKFGFIDGKLLLSTPGAGPPPIGPGTLNMLMFIMLLTFSISAAQIASPQLVIRFYAARDREVIRRGAILTPLIIFLFAATVFSVGPLAWAIVPRMVNDPNVIKGFLKNPDALVPFLMMELFPPGINALLLTAILAAAMSTINSLVMMCGTSLARDILQVLRPSIDEKTVLNLTRLSIPIFALVPLYLARNPPDIIIMIVGFAFSITVSAFLAPLVVGLYWRKGSAIGASASMILASLTCVIWYLEVYKVKSWVYPVVPGLLVGLASYFILSYLFPRESDLG